MNIDGVTLWEIVTVVAFIAGWLVGLLQACLWIKRKRRFPTCSSCEYVDSVSNHSPCYSCKNYSMWEERT